MGRLVACMGWNDTIVGLCCGAATALCGTDDQLAY
jgi:hypothetical protein